AHLIERFIQLKYFLEQLGRRLLLLRAFPAQAGEAKQIFDASHGIAERAVGVIELRGAVQRKLPLVPRSAHEIIGMQLPGKRVKPQFEIRQVELEFSGQAEKREVIGAARQRLNLSARGTEVRAAGRRGTAPARHRCRRCDGWCAHDLTILLPRISGMLFCSVGLQADILDSSTCPPEGGRYSRRNQLPHRLLKPPGPGPSDVAVKTATHKPPGRPSTIPGRNCAPLGKKNGWRAPPPGQPNVPPVSR